MQISSCSWMINVLLIKYVYIQKQYSIIQNNTNLNNLNLHIYANLEIFNTNHITNTQVIYSF